MLADRLKTLLIVLCLLAHGMIALTPVGVTQVCLGGLLGSICPGGASILGLGEHHHHHHALHLDHAVAAEDDHHDDCRAPEWRSASPDHDGCCVDVLLPDDPRRAERAQSGADLTSLQGFAPVVSPLAALRSPVPDCRGPRRFGCGPPPPDRGMLHLRI